jgi:hypothetical protein
VIRNESTDAMPCVSRLYHWPIRCSGVALPHASRLPSRALGDIRSDLVRAVWSRRVRCSPQDRRRWQRFYRVCPVPRSGTTCPRAAASLLFYHIVFGLARGSLPEWSTSLLRGPR